MTKTPCTPAADYRTGAPREDGWTHQRQATFLLMLAQTGIVAEACKAAEMSESSAYLLRRERRGALFALGWKAAHFMARDVLADQVVKIARSGVQCVVTKAEGIMHRTTLSTGPLLAVINRLDRRADSLDDREMAIIRRLCANFDEFIDVILTGGHQADFLAFLKRTPDPLHHPLAQIMQMEAEDALEEEDAVAAEAAPDADAAPAAPAPAAAAPAAPEAETVPLVASALRKAPAATRSAPAATVKAPAAKRAIDPIVVEESAIFSQAVTPDISVDLAAFAAMAGRRANGARMAA